MLSEVGASSNLIYERGKKMPGALEGIRIIEFGPYIALPYTGRLLATLGAEVIKVETNKILDEMAWLPSWSKGMAVGDWHSVKKRVSLDVRTPKGSEIFKNLLKVSDVLITNFRRDILARWGVDFPEIREANPDIVILWLTGMGGTGPYGGYKGFGQMQQHLCGISASTGFPDSQAPGYANTSYADYHAAVFHPIAVIGAIMRRKRTGKTALMDSCIFKSGAMTVGPSLLDYQANNRLPEKIGNRDAYASPHGAYPCRGEDRWCAIAVFTDKEWESFCEVIGSPPWTMDSKFRTLTERIKNADELDALVGKWTVGYDAEKVMEKMQKAGVPAGIVSKGQDLAQSEQLKERNFYRESIYYKADTETYGKDWELGTGGLVSAVPIELSKTPCIFKDVSKIGEDNDYVYQELLKMPPEEIKTLEKEEVLL